MLFFLLAFLLRVQLALQPLHLSFGVLERFAAERPAPRLLSLGILSRTLVATCPAAIVAFLVLLPVAAAILATAATRRTEQRQADYLGKAQTQEHPATHGHSKNGIASGFRFSCIRHRAPPCLARFVPILTARPCPQAARRETFFEGAVGTREVEITILNLARNAATTT